MQKGLKPVHMDAMTDITQLVIDSHNIIRDRFLEAIEAAKLDIHKLFIKLDDDDPKQFEYDSQDFMLEYAKHCFGPLLILGLYRNVESMTKAILRSQLAEGKVKEFYKFEKLTEYLKGLNSDFNTLPGSKEMVELRNYTNIIRHGGELPNNLVKEYNRLSPFVVPYLQALTKVVCPNHN